MNRTATSALLCLGLGGGWVQAQANKAATNSPIEQEVLAAHSERLRALVSGDVATLDRLLSDDLTYTSVAGRVQSKADIIADAKSGALRVATADADDVKVRVYGGTTAVVTYRSAASFVDRGQTIAGSLRATSVYVKRDGRWQLVAQQLNRIASQ